MAVVEAMVDDVNGFHIKKPYRSFGDTIPVPTVARVHFLCPKLWYLLIALFDDSVKKQTSPTLTLFN